MNYTKKDVIEMRSLLSEENFMDKMYNILCTECPFEEECSAYNGVKTTCAEIITDILKKEEEQAMETKETTKKVVLFNENYESTILTVNESQYKLLEWLNNNDWLYEDTVIQPVHEFNTVDLT